MKGSLILSDGSAFHGELLGGPAAGPVVCDNTMIDYEAMLAEPAYIGAILVMCYPGAGFFGVTEKLLASEVTPAAVVVRGLCGTPSNYMCRGPLGEFLLSRGVSLLHGVDTRSVVRRFRAGAVSGAIIEGAPNEESISKVKSLDTYSPTTSSMSTPRSYPAAGAAVAILDFGGGETLARRVNALGHGATVYPRGASAGELITSGAKGVIITDGPGDPLTMGGLIPAVKEIIRSGLPVLALGLGHFLCALARGLEIKPGLAVSGWGFPIRDAANARIYIGPKTRGIRVLPGASCEVTYADADDGSARGLRYTGTSVSGVDFTPDDSCDGFGTGHILADFLAGL